MRRFIYILITLIFGGLLVFSQTRTWDQTNKIQTEGSTVYGTMQFVVLDTYIVVADVNITFFSDSPYSHERAIKAFQSINASLIQAVRESGMNWPERGYSPAPVVPIAPVVTLIGEPPKPSTSIPVLPVLSMQDTKLMIQVCDALITRINMSSTRERIMKCEIFNFARIRIK